ncbi:Transmembrane protein 161A/B [Dillenia turbinata]|uniref:Transmembrane protein 161A/B n=1 Tax=Dillenia turbinata TaxID=194707 RepID=A0AAN8VVC8_9MAGN
MTNLLRNLTLHLSLSFLLTYILTFFRFPVLFLRGLHTYIHPDNIQSNARAAIRRPDTNDSSHPRSQNYLNLSSNSYVEIRKKNKSKEKFEFDENNAQIFRLRLADGHLETRLYFDDYFKDFVVSLVTLSCLLLHTFISEKEENGVLVNGSIVPILLGFVSVFKVLVSLARVSFEKSAHGRSEKQLSIISGVLGFVIVFVICSGNPNMVFDFDFESLDGYGKFCVALVLGLFSGFLVMPATKSARAFWLGTDQIQCNLSMVSCGWFGRVLIYANYLMNAFTALLWINPFAELLINKNISGSQGGHAKKLVGYVGLEKSEFENFRLWCLLISGLLQILTLRSNLQMYMNEALLSWYQRLHASKVPDLDFSRAKVFLHNHYMCLAVLQFFGPPVLVLLSLGLSHIDSNLFENLHWVCSVLPCSAFVKQMGLFMAWWIVIVSVVFTSANLIMYRLGILYVS